MTPRTKGLRRTGLRRTSKNRIPQLIRKLDILFSPYIRKRDARKPCIDLCGRPGKKQAGHFRRRELKSTRFDPRNVNGQNEYCNSWDNDGYRHAQGIDKRWGAGTAAELERISRKTKQWTEKELTNLIAVLQEWPGKYEKEYAKLTMEK